MEIGTEISQKIRSAIKAKLIELGAYVDDELPDYIMVMVANKKTQKQMTDDLSLFLNTNTEKFTSWLHSLLKKLQSINTDQPPSKHKHKEKDRQKGEKRKHRSSHSEKSHKSTESEKQPTTTTITESKGETKKKETEKPEKKSNENKDEPVTSAVKPASTTQVTEDVEGDEIKIIENTDEFNEENKELEKREIKKTSSTGKPPPTKVSKTEKATDVKKQAVKVSTREEKVSNKSQTSSSSSQKHKEESKIARKKPTSFVAAVKRKYVEEEEEYDPLNPAVGSVASVVHGPTRKSSVPKSLQANKSLLMKAVSDAEKSVTTIRKTDLSSQPESSRPGMRSDRQPVDLSRRLKTAAGLQLISRSKRKEMLQGMKFVVEDEPPREPVKKQRMSGDGLENMKYTVKNESVAKSQPKKTPPKTKAQAVAPSRVAASALRSLDQQSKADSKKTLVSAEDENEDEERGAANSDDDVDDNDDSSVDEKSMSDEDENEDMSDDEEGESEEIEIEITDRAAQTVVNMRDKNFTLTETRNKAVCTDVDAQTDVQDNGHNENASYKLTKEKLEEIDTSLLNLFIENTLPFDFVENESFKLFAKTLQSKYHFPKRKKLMMEVGMLYNTVKDNLKSELTGVQSVAFTHNTWSSVGSNMYDSVSIHFVTSDWNLRSAVLHTTPLAADHISESIVQHLEESRVKWGLPEPIVVADDSDTEHRVFEMLEWEKNLCFGCCIHKIIKGCLNGQDVSEFLDRGRSLLLEVQNNGPALEVFELKKKLLLPKLSQTHKLSIDDKANWSSTLDMISKLSEQTPALHAAVMDTELTNQGVDLRNQLYSFNEQSILESLVRIISHFKTATEILTNNDNPTLQKVIPIFVKLEKALEKDADDSSMIVKVKTEMKRQIDSFLKESRNICLLACLVHPQTKQMAFVSQKDKDNVKVLLFDEVKVQCEGEYSESHRDAEEDETFRTGRRTNRSRQKKAMSELAQQSDLRYVVVNKEEEEHEGGAVETNDDDSNSAVSQNTDSQNEESQDGCRSVVSNRSEISASTSNQNQRSPTREVHPSDDSKEDSDSSPIKLPMNLSITVENDWLDDVICAGEELKSPSQMAKIELDLYMAEPASSKNPLSWWKEKHVLYPRISKVARKLLAIPASSVTAHDVFCLDSKPPKYKIFQIKPEHVDMMVFLKKNKTLYE